MIPTSRPRHPCREGREPPVQNRASRGESPQVLRALGGQGRALLEQPARGDGGQFDSVVPGRQELSLTPRDELAERLQLVAVYLEECLSEGPPLLVTCTIAAEVIQDL